MLRAQAFMRRRGMTTVQLAVMIAVITLGVFASVRSMGTAARTKLNNTAGDVANPANLPARFGS